MSNFQFNQNDIDKMEILERNAAIKRRKDKIKKGIVYTIIYTILVLIVFICVIPFWIVLVNSTRSGTQINLSGVALLPSKYLLANFRILQENSQIDILLGFWNSLKISIMVTVLSGYFSALTAYGFYMYKFKGNKTLFFSVIILMMVPTQLSFIGFVKLMIRYNLYNTPWPLIIPAIASVGTVFFLRQFISATVNKEVIESARIDGANELYIFHRIGFPLMMPGIATMSIFAFIGSWNNYLGALLILKSPEVLTLPLMIAKLRALNVWWQNQGAIFLGFAFSVVPIVIVFIIFSRFLVDSIAAGAVKG